jgi:transposase InsO family protein
VKYAFIDKSKIDLPKTRLCELLGVSRSGFYDWRERKDKPNQSKLSREIIDHAVKTAFANNKERYGAPRLTKDLNESGFKISLNTVAASLRRQQLCAKAGRKFKATTNSLHALPVAPNLLDQDFSCESINEKWCGDITYLWTDEGWLYLAVVIDLYSRKVVGWSMNTRMKKQLVIDAMTMAINARGNVEGLIMHTDRGSQYCSKKFQALLTANGIRSSMSKKGDCFDNACAESFFHSLKVECIHGENIKTREDMRETVFEYIEIDYNRKRRHTAIGSISPVNYELLNAA